MKRMGTLPALLVVFAIGLVSPVPALGQDSPREGLYKIYSNLGVNGACYGTQGGWVVGLGQSIAMPFTPKVDATLSEIVLGLLHGVGGDFARVSLNQDDNGLPGRAVRTWVLGKLGLYKWHSCYVSVARSREGLPLKAGTQYWVVAAAPYSTWDTWEYTYNDIQGNFAYEENNGGWTRDDSYLSAFGVFGTKSKIAWSRSRP
jgi:hypothetical protein